MMAFSDSIVPMGVGGNATGVANRGMDGAARHAVTQSNIAKLVHGDAAHPAGIAVGGVSALLEHGRSGIGTPKFVPAHAVNLAMLASANANRVGDNERFVRAAEVAIRQPVHQPVAEGIELLRGTALRDTSSAAACR